MATNIDKIARLLGAEIVEQVPETGPGLLGAYRIADQVSRLQFARSSITSQNVHRQVSLDRQNRQLSLSEATFDKLEVLAKKTSVGSEPISPVELAAQLLEAAVDQGLIQAKST